MSSNVQFPNQPTIIAYFNGHPLKNAIDTNEENFPQSLEQVSAHFACKEVDKNKIPETLKSIFETIFKKECVKAETLLKGLAQVVSDWKEIDKRQPNSEPDSHTEAMERIYNNGAASMEKVHKNDMSELEGPITIAVKMYETVLRDLADNAWYTPPLPGEKKWERHVEQINKT